MIDLIIQNLTLMAVFDVRFFPWCSFDLYITQPVFSTYLIFSAEKEACTTYYESPARASRPSFLMTASP